MKFSIAMPVYGQAGFLPSALTSLLAQTSPMQIAVMDATPDESVQQVLEHFADLFSYRRHGPDAGQTAAIQEGWDNTDGDIVAWLCADDYYFPDALAKVERTFLANPDVDVVYGNAVLVNERGQFLGYFPALNRDISAITKKCCICQPSCFVRRSALDKIGKLNPDLHYIMDWDLWTRLYLSGAKFHCLDEYLSVVRMYKGTKTASRSMDRFFEIAQHLFRHTSFVSAIKSFIHFYCYEWLSLLGIEEAILKLLSIFGFKRPLKSTKVHHCLNYGFGELGCIDSQVDIFLPWYHKSLPTAVKLMSDEKVPPSIHLNGTALEANMDAPFSYAIPAVDLHPPILHLRLSSWSGTTWRLQSVEIL